jgi:hypothetical protein
MMSMKLNKIKFDNALSSISDLLDELEDFALNEKNENERISILIRRKELEDMYYLLQNDLEIYIDFGLIEGDENKNDNKKNP